MGVGIPPSRLLFNLASTINWLKFIDVSPDSGHAPGTLFGQKVRKALLYALVQIIGGPWRLVTAKVCSLFTEKRSFTMVNTLDFYLWPVQKSWISA